MHSARVETVRELTRTLRYALVTESAHAIALLLLLYVL
jgi:hypothetical protein